MWYVDYYPEDRILKASENLCFKAAHLNILHQKDFTYDLSAVNKFRQSGTTPRDE